MGELFIGHGGLDPAGYSYNDGMGIVAIPPGTTLQFYTDAGQNLRFGDLQTALAQLQAPWPVLTSENVTYNLALSKFGETTTFERWTAAVKSGTPHMPHLPGFDIEDEVPLCNGEVGQCPTDPRENRPHACTGILARFTGELHWIACTGFVLPMDEAEMNETLQVVNAARGDTPPSVFLGSDPDSWSEHTHNLLIRLKEMLESYKSLGTPEKFVEHFKGDGYTDEEREHVIAADMEIAEVVGQYST